MFFFIHVMNPAAPATTVTEDDKLLELDFHTRKEITFNNISPYSISIPLKKVQRNNATPETMLYNLTKCINWNDISNIDYTL